MCVKKSVTTLTKPRSIVCRVITGIKHSQGWIHHIKQLSWCRMRCPHPTTTVLKPLKLAKHTERGQRKRRFRVLGACLWQTSVRYCLCLALGPMKNWWSSLEWCYHQGREESEHGKTASLHLCLPCANLHHLWDPPSISSSHRATPAHICGHCGERVSVWEEGRKKQWAKQIKK